MHLTESGTSGSPRHLSRRSSHGREGSCPVTGACRRGSTPFLRATSVSAHSRLRAPTSSRTAPVRIERHRGAGPGITRPATAVVGLLPLSRARAYTEGRSHGSGRCKRNARRYCMARLRSHLTRASCAPLPRRAIVMHDKVEIVSANNPGEAASRGFLLRESRVALDALTMRSAPVAADRASFRLRPLSLTSAKSNNHRRIRLAVRNGRVLF
jgi:hypothetical protein